MTAQTTYIIPEKDRDAMIARLSRFVGACLPGKKLKVTIQQYRKSRSLEQNNALFGLAYARIRDVTGNELADLHDYYCKKFFGVVETDVLGEIVQKPRRTTTTNEDGKRELISTVDMSDFWLMVQTHAASELGIDIPDPDPMWRMHEEQA